MWAKTVRETELRIVRNRETKKNFKVLYFWTRRGTRRIFEDPSRYAMDQKYLRFSGFLRGLARAATKGHDQPWHRQQPRPQRGVCTYAWQSTQASNMPLLGQA
ncbi:hypothetical protein E3N88_35226 [Mikania micrantha]|uniref:Uncharacterized protein n=1 Tax=Mikania micrantha TaxID=192012 RepID=A0A5N6M1A5_9ASTR|nr:hypothetical protein E3N88_35226 [Mikania micrantha]